MHLVDDRGIALSSWAAERIEGLEDRTLLSAVTTTTVTPSATALTYGQTETLTASVSSQAGIPNAGTVTFFDSTTSLGSSPVSNGTAVLPTTALSAGVHAITATERISRAVVPRSDPTRSFRPSQAPVLLATAATVASPPRPN